VASTPFQKPQRNSSIHNTAEKRELKTIFGILLKRILADRDFSKTVATSYLPYAFSNARIAFFFQGAMMVKLFARYVSVGALNTAIHWVVFSALYASHFSQSIANLVAFCIAVTFSFYANAKWTFKAEATTTRYLLFVLFMGMMALAVGWGADRLHILPIFTLVFFSAISLICGFIYSKLVIFRERK